MPTQDVAKAAFEASPPVGYVALRFFGVSMPDWVAVFTGVYILVQLAYLVWKWRQQWLKRQPVEAG